MGLFTSKSPLEKELGQAAKRKVDTTGALAVAEEFIDGAYGYLLVFPDRVQVVRKSKIGALFPIGAGSQSIPIREVTSVTAERTGIWIDVTVTSAGSVIKFRPTRPSVAEIVSNAILEARQA